MGGGSGGGNSTTTTKADPWVGVQPYLTQGYQQLAGLYGPGAQGPQYFPGDTVAQPAPNEAYGQNLLNSQVGQMGALANNAQQNLYGISNGGNYGVSVGQGYGNLGASGLQQLAQQSGSGAGQSNQAANTLLGYGGNGVIQSGTSSLGQAIQGLSGYGNSGAAQAGNAFTGSSAQQLYNAGDPANNPFFQQALQSAIRPVTQQFQEQVMPAIKQGAQSAGQMGGSRQGIAEGIAARGYQDTVGDISANMGNAAYAQGLQALQASGQLGQGMTGQALGAQLNAGQLGQNLANMGLGSIMNGGQLGQGLAGLGGQASSSLGSLGSNFYGQGLTGLGQGTALTNGVQQAQMAPGQMMNAIGQQQTADAQRNIDADIARYNYGQNLPYGMIQDYLNTLNGAATIGGSQTSQQSGGGNRATGALGGAATGAAIGSAFAPGMGTAIGAGAGALYGLFM